MFIGIRRSLNKSRLPRSINLQKASLITTCNNTTYLSESRSKIGNYNHIIPFIQKRYHQNDINKESNTNSINFNNSINSNNSIDSINSINSVNSINSDNSIIKSSIMKSILKGTFRICVCGGIIMLGGASTVAIFPLFNLLPPDTIVRITALCLITAGSVTAMLRNLYLSEFNDGFDDDVIIKYENYSCFFLGSSIVLIVIFLMLAPFLYMF